MLGNFPFEYTSSASIFDSCSGIFPKSRSILSAHNICAAFNFLQHCNFTHNILFLGEESLSKLSDGGEIGFVRFIQIHNATFNLNGHKSGR